MRKIFMSVFLIAAVATFTIKATTAFFSDTESAKGNVFSSGGLDLKVGNKSWKNIGGVAMFDENLSWEQSDIGSRLFFNFSDLIPGDFGGNLASVKAQDNSAWLCADINITSNDDVSCNEPETGDDETCNEPNSDKLDGDLAKEINVLLWVDDGDNVLETNETDKIIAQGSASVVLAGGSYPLADSTYTIVADKNPLAEDTNYFIGQAWCFGALSTNALAPTDDNSPLTNSGFICNGMAVNNASQTDNLQGDITLRAVQARNNAGFVCGSQQ